MIDLHSHILSGVDDGAPDLKASLAIARASAADGVWLTVATPHLNGRYMPTPDAIQAGVAELNEAVAAEGLSLWVSPGAEIAMTELPHLDDQALRRLALGASKTLLIESPYVDAVPFLNQMLFDLQARGFRVLLAHPERSPLFANDHQRLRALVDRGVLCSITVGSLAGRFGRRVQSVALEMVQRRLVHNLASDAHNTNGRPPGLTKGIEHADRLLPGFSNLAAWLSEEVPTALLGDEALPPYPDVEMSERRRVGLRLRKR